MCLVQLTDFVLTDMDKGKHADMILIDLQKAFEKMTYLSFKTPVIKWFESYLSNIKLFVSEDNFVSET